MCPMISLWSIAFSEDAEDAVHVLRCSGSKYNFAGRLISDASVSTRFDWTDAVRVNKGINHKMSNGTLKFELNSLSVYHFFSTKRMITWILKVRMRHYCLTKFTLVLLNFFKLYFTSKNNCFQKALDELLHKNSFVSWINITEQIPW